MSEVVGPLLTAEQLERMRRYTDQDLMTVFPDGKNYDMDKLLKDREALVALLRDCYDDMRTCFDREYGVCNHTDGCEDDLLAKLRAVPGLVVAE